MRLLAIALLCCATAAQAQAPLTGTTGPGPGLPSVQPATPNTAIPAARRSRTLEDRFAEANTTHDGHLTAEQARAHMPAVAHHFDEIDTTHQGYVTVDQIKDYRRAQRAERRAAKKAAQAQ